VVVLLDADEKALPDVSTIEGRLARLAYGGRATPDADAPRVDPPSLVRLGRYRCDACLERSVRRPHRHRRVQQRPADVTGVAALVEIGSALADARA
jgi:hypothetical protein